MKKQFIAAGIAATMGVTGIGAGVAHAATSDSSTNSNPMSSLVDAISTKFSLDKTEVQAVFDEEKTAKQAEREQSTADSVASLVTDGTITQAQADAINAKRAEVAASREANKDSTVEKTDEERKTARETEKAELEQWASDNGLDAKYIRYVMSNGHGGGGGPGQGRGDRDKGPDTGTDAAE